MPNVLLTIVVLLYLWLHSPASAGRLHNRSLLDQRLLRVIRKQVCGNHMPKERRDTRKCVLRSFARLSGLFVGTLEDQFEGSFVVAHGIASRALSECLCFSGHNFVLFSD